MGNAKVCAGAGYTDFSKTVAFLTKNAAKKEENGYAKRVYNGDKIEKQVCDIFGFPPYKKHGKKDQPDILITGKGRKFVGEIKSFEDDRVVVTTDQFERYAELAPTKKGDIYNFFYLFAKHDDERLTDVYVADYSVMERTLKVKEPRITRWRLRKRHSRKIDVMEQDSQTMIFGGYQKDEFERLKSEIKIKETAKRNKEYILKKYNMKGANIRIKELSFKELCPCVKIITDKNGRNSIFIRYPSNSIGFIKNAKYPAVTESLNGKKKLVQTVFSEI